MLMAVIGWMFNFLYYVGYLYHKSDMAEYDKRHKLSSKKKRIILFIAFVPFLLFVFALPYLFIVVPLNEWK